jgi:hypothetical protein
MGMAREPGLSGAELSLMDSGIMFRDVPDQERRFLSLGGYLDFLAERVTPDMVLADRLGQAHLDKLLDGWPHTAQGGPAVLAVHGQNSTWYTRSVFTLSERDGPRHYYFFDVGWPVEAVPDYLRPDDTVPSGRFTPVYDSGYRKTGAYRLVELPFNKPLNRVPRSGGPVELFNYRTGRWEPESRRPRRYAAPLRRRLGGTLMQRIGLD